MAEKTFTLEFNGYYFDVEKLEKRSGVYCVYSCIPPTDSKNGTISNLIYIGESGDVQDRHAEHEKLPVWEAYLAKGEKLCFTYALVESASRNRCEAALIFKHQPPANTQHKESFRFDKTTVKLAGKTAKLATSFTLERTE